MILKLIIAVARNRNFPIIQENELSTIQSRGGKPCRVSIFIVK